MHDVIVIGAGPAGCHVAAGCARMGFNTLVIEEHPLAGVPVHCTGIVSDRFIEEFSVPPGLIQKRVSSFRILSPGGVNVLCPSSVQASVLDRGKFDEYCADYARRTGAHFAYDARATAVQQSREGVTVKIGDNESSRTVTGKVCVIATGSMSELPFFCGMGRPHRYLKSLQVEVEIADIEGAEMYLGNRYSPGSFAYAVSVNGVKSKIGIISESDPREGYHNLLHDTSLRDRIINVKSPVKIRRIPLGFPSRTVNKRILAVGDAAGQLKTTTCGGLYFGMLCAGIVVDLFRESYDGRDFDPAILSQYDRRWKRRIGKELSIGILLRHFLQHTDDDDLDRLCVILEKEPMRRILENTVSFDFHQHFLRALINVPEMRDTFILSARKYLKNRLFKAL
ncbi:MAG: geranylgeranyl reductase family protein [Candidatus Xenobiia bacterium LiM19]